MGRFARPIYGGFRPIAVFPKEVCRTHPIVIGMQTLSMCLATPQLYSWGARAMYVGFALNLSAHRNAVAVLAIGLDAPFDVATDALRPGRGTCTVRSMLIAPNTLHHLTCAGTMAFFYVDAVSRDLRQLQRRTLSPVRAELQPEYEDHLIDLLVPLAKGEKQFPEIVAALEAEILAVPTSARDERIARAIRHLHVNVTDRLSLDELAEIASLSPSRFRHLFVETTGVPLRRYKIWLAFGTAMRLLKSGATLTAAAHAAGFASSAHFSSAFRIMFGLAPSQLTRAGLRHICVTKEELKAGRRENA